MTYFVVGIYTRLPVWGGIISLDLNREKCVRMLVQLTCEQNWFQWFDPHFCTIHEP